MSSAGESCMEFLFHDVPEKVAAMSVGSESNVSTNVSHTEARGHLEEFF